MDYLDFAKSTLSKALGPQQPSVNFTVGQMSPFQAPQSLFKLYDGTKKDDSSQISVFVFEIKKGDKTGLLLARNALKKTMTLRFPGMLTYIDGAETPSRIIIGTEKVESFSTFFGKSRDSMLTKFGVYRVAATLYSLQESNIVHGNLNLESIFVTKAGEFKLASANVGLAAWNTHQV